MKQDTTDAGHGTTGGIDDGSPTPAPDVALDASGASAVATRTPRRSIRGLMRDLSKGSASERSVRIGLLIVEVGPAVVLVVVSILVALLTPLFLTERNLTNLGFQSAALIALGCGQLLVVLTRGVDLSVGSVIGLTCASGSLLYDSGWNGLAIVVLILLIGCTVGTVNGLLLVKGRLPHALVATLATLGIVRGIAFLFTGGDILSGQAPLIETLGSGLIGPVPVATVLVAGLALATWVILKWMKWGRWIYAIGGNPEAARRAGIPVDRVLISVYIICGFTAAIAGLIVAGRTGVGDANAGQLAELDAITAVMIGGVSFLGGRGSVSNALIGALTVTVIKNGLNLLGVTAFWELISIGVMLVVAVELNVFRGYLEARFRVLQASGR